MTKQHYHILKMGGTIEFFDPAYDGINNRLLKLNTTIDSYLQNIIQPHFTYSTQTITQKDSRDITVEDRQMLAKAIDETEFKNIIVTHGTFTMVETAKYLQEHCVLTDKKVILTGSMIPIIGFAASDAGFNLGFVMASQPYMSPGAYISINGGMFTPDEVSKNTEIFRFE
jgi:L-asparaginase